MHQNLGNGPPFLYGSGSSLWLTVLTYKWQSSFRFSTASRKKHKSLDRDGLLSFIASSLDKVEGNIHICLMHVSNVCGVCEWMRII